MQDKTKRRETPAGQQAYRRPVLTEYGSVAKLARGSASQNADGGPGHKSYGGANQQGQG
jgi:hypothetical protein